MEKDKVLVKIYRSRKTYIPIYILILLVISYFIYYYIFISQEVDNKLLIYLIVGIVVTIKITEIHRIRDWWAVTESSFIESKGILSKSIREIDFHTIADISLNQSLIKRFLHYGNVEIRKFLNETSIIIPGINHPERFINFLRRTIRKEVRDGRKMFHTS